VLRGAQRFHQESERSRSGEDGGMAGWSHGSLLIAHTTHPRLRFYATLGYEPEVELVLV